MKMAVALFSLAVIFIACEQKTAENKPAADESIALPMEVTYKGTPEIGSMKNVQTVMEWNKRLSQLNLDVGDLIADTLTWHLADGNEMTAPRDSAISVLSQFAADLSSIQITYIAAVPVNMIGQNHEWVFSWTDETYTHKNGTVDHSFFHEDYRLEDGRIREVYQYARKQADETIAPN